MIERLKSILETGGNHLGDILFWTLADARIERTTLESVWVGASLDGGLLPDPPTPEKALKLAVREAQLGQRNRLVRLGKENEDEIVFAVVREDRHEDGSLSYVQESRVQLDRKTSVLTTDRPSHDLAAAILSAFDTSKNTHPADDVRRAIVKALHSFAAVTLREGGGVYFTPAPFADKLRRLQAAVEKIGSSRVYVLPVHESPEAKCTLGEIAQGTIESELECLKNEIAQFTAAPPGRSSTLLRRFDSFEALRTKARLYRDVLAVEVQDLDLQLDVMSAAVEEMLNQKNHQAA